MALIDMSETYQMTNVGDHIDGTDVYQSNPNLLDNPWFTVNQRGVNGAVSGGQYGPDRWSLNASSGVSANMGTGYITLPSGGYEIIQTIEDLSSTYGKQVTYSVLDDTGEIRSATITMPTTPAVQNYINTTINGVRLRLRYLNPNWRVFMDAQDGAAHTIKAAKLELGSVSTLANDTPPNYAEELAKCQYYFRRILCTGSSYVAIGYSVAATEFCLVFPFAMRTTPSISFGGALTAYYSGGNSPITALAIRGTLSGFVSIGATTTGLTAGNIVSLSMATNAYIDLFADL